MSEAEGGCGVIGVACADKVEGRHLLPGLTQMRNRGNGKGGGIAAAGLSAEFFGVSQEVLDEYYLLAIAYLDVGCLNEVEKQFIYSQFDVEHVFVFPHIDSLDLPILPPEVVVYFVKPKEGTVDPDTFVYNNSAKLNQTFYSATGEKRAFVLSHGKDLLILKLVGFGDDAIRYYKLEDFKAHVWIGHHRYPTKGKVWHPGGAHPFIGMNEALVHNGDFANYFSICEYLGQRGILPQFLTDTEVAVLLFDLWHRVYQYPLEYVIEALAPTTERDFVLLPQEKQEVYQDIQVTHMHNSPDGPWFFLIAQSVAKHYRLIGITDTSMLRPQVFALQKGEAPIGLAGSEKQAIDATLASLAKSDNRFWGTADYYWNARGGSHQDGGAFSFTVHDGQLVCTDKFGRQVHAELLHPSMQGEEKMSIEDIPDLSIDDLYLWAKGRLLEWDYGQAQSLMENILKLAPHTSIEVLTKLLDGHYPLKKMRRSSLKDLINGTITKFLFSAKIGLGTMVLNGDQFAAEGADSLALEIVKQHKEGFENQFIFNCKGHRFIGSGLGPATQGMRIDVYGSSGDYLASGIDGAEIQVHGSGQDQLAQMMKSGKLVVYGGVGQTFMYGAKGGTAFIRGSCAGRPLINAVGKPRVVINGTCLDYLAESFMAGNPLNGGGFVILNAITFDEEGAVVEMATPYPGSNLFSLASGGAVYVRDPQELITKDQLNGGRFEELSSDDWDILLPYLEENDRLFNIPVERLLMYQGLKLPFDQIYRKIVPASARVLQEEEAWVKAKD